MKNTDKIVKAIAIGGTAAGLIVGGLGGAVLFPKEVIVPEPYPVPYEVQVQVEKIVNQTIEVPVIKEVNVTKEILVDNQNLKLVLDYIYDKDADVEFLLDNLKESEVNKIVDRIIFMNDIEVLAKDYARVNIAEEVHREVVNGTKLYKADIDRIRINKDVSVEDVSFKYNDASVIVSGSFRHNSKWYIFESEVQFKDSKVEDFKVISLEEDN